MSAGGNGRAGSNQYSEEVKIMAVMTREKEEKVLEGSRYDFRKADLSGMAQFGMATILRW